MITSTEIQLITQAIEAGKKYKEIVRITGEGYNIFSVLKVETNETRLHSAFIADLLNPSGLHGLKNVFLKLFVEEFLPPKFEFFTENVTVEIEKHIGRINNDSTEGGRIDIYLTDHLKNQIFIENKVYAGDQKNQLVRYSNHNKKAALFYLCLSDKIVSKESHGNLEKEADFFVKHYDTHLLSWLHKCRKEAIAHPILRETIYQYINLIKALTGNTTNENMKQELAESIIKDKEFLEAAFSIADSIDKACDILLDKFELLLKEIADELGLISEMNIDWKKSYTGFLFYKESWQKAYVNFQFQSTDKNLIYGICRDKEEKDLTDELTVEVYNKLKPLVGTYNSWWLFYKKIEEPFSNWANKEIWFAILDSSIKKIIKDKVENILECLGDYVL